MKNKLLSLLLCIAAVLAAATPAAAESSHAYTVAEVENLCDGIVGYKEGEWGAASAQDWINGGLTQTAGVSAEFYIIALSQRGYYDFSSYENALLGYIRTHDVYSATSREKYALALIASGSTDSYITQVADEAIGGQGLMSLVFGLHILNNGYGSKMYSAEGLVNTILSYQLSDGGWAVIGDRGDVDVTAMTLQALAPYYHRYSDVEAAIDRALTLLSNAQQESGGFYGMGVENCESATQVLAALSDLGVDQNADSRFIKNGHTVLDAILSYRNGDGSFAHTGSGFNETATMEAFYAMTAYLRFRYGKGPLYVLDRRRPESVQPVTQASQQQQQNNANQQNNGNQNGSSQNHGGNQSSGGSSGSGQQIVYINGQAFIEATDSKGRTSTVAVTPTGATSATSATTAAAPTEATNNTQPTSAAHSMEPTAEEEATVDETPPAKKGGYKPIAVICVLAAGGIAAGALFLLKKRNKKHYIAVGILTAAGILFILLTDFRSTDSYRAVSEKADAVGTVTMSIRCNAVKNDKKPDYIPEDCVILDDTEFTVSEGDTAYDILLEASKRYDIRIDNRGTVGNAYIAGIADLYEFEYGDLSGWMYRVNGEFPDVGCQSYTLSDGDRIEWLYTKNIGKDL